MVGTTGETRPIFPCLLPPTHLLPRLLTGIPTFHLFLPSAEMVLGPEGWLVLAGGGGLHWFYKGDGCDWG